MSGQNKNSFPRLCPSSNKRNIFKCTDHANNISKKLQTFYEKKEFFDMLLIAGVDNVKVQAHRIVLSVSSDYFLAMFRSTLQEASADEVVLKEIDGATMKLIIDFMYTASIEICSETVESILRAADFLQMSTLTTACCDFMGEQLDASNCLGIALFAEQHSCKALHKKASSFAFKHFEKVWIEKEFIQLNEDQLSKYLSSDDLFAHSEDKVFQSLLAWVEYDKENREKCIFKLLSHVRFTSLKPKFIIENMHSVCKTVECYKLICSWLLWHLSPESRSKFPIEHTKRRKTHQKLTLVSGESTSDLKVQTFNADLNTWLYERVPSPPKQISEYRAISINKKLIIAGGKIDGVVTNSVQSFDFETKEWTDLPPMRLGRSYPAVAELSGDLYIVGGQIDGIWSRSVEKYDFSTREWQDVTSLSSQFQWITVAVHDGFIYAVGNGSHTMECYDSSANKWTQRTFAEGKLEFINMATVDEHLYIVGGYYNNAQRNRVDRYHPATDTWKFVKSLKIPRNGIRCTGLNNRLLAYGGHSDTGVVDLVEEYDPDTNEWNTLPSLLPHKLSYYHNNIFPM